MTGIPYNYKDYINDVTKMRQRGAISAGGRGLAKVEAFADSPNQIMKNNDVVEEHDQELQRIMKLAGLL